MRANDLFVGGVGVVIGLAFLGSAIYNGKWFLQTRKGGWLAQRVGVGKARLILGLVGLALVALGAAIGFGFRRQVF